VRITVELLEAILGRRTIHDFSSAPVAREQIETMLQAACWAPNHKLTNPWAFFVVSGAAKEQLAQLRGNLKRSKYDDPTSPQAERSYDRAYSELATVPYAILVCQRLSDDPTRLEEDRLAVGCAIQNLMLAAYSMSIGTFWGTGPLLNHPDTFALLGVSSAYRGVGFVLVGHAAAAVKIPKREPASTHTTWVE
jgi:nitroreductase